MKVFPIPITGSTGFLPLLITANKYCSKLSADRVIQAHRLNSSFIQKHMKRIVHFFAKNLPSFNWKSISGAKSSSANIDFTVKISLEPVGLKLLTRKHHRDYRQRTRAATVCTSLNRLISSMNVSVFYQEHNARLTISNCSLSKPRSLLCMYSSVCQYNDTR